MPFQNLEEEVRAALEEAIMVKQSELDETQAKIAQMARDALVMRILEVNAEVSQRKVTGNYDNSLLQELEQEAEKRNQLVKELRMLQQIREHMPESFAMQISRFAAQVRQFID